MNLKPVIDYIQKNEGATLTDIARDLNCSKQRLHNLCKAKTNPCLDLVNELAELYGICPLVLFSQLYPDI